MAHILAPQREGPPRTIRIDPEVYYLGPDGAELLDWRWQTWLNRRCEGLPTPRAVVIRGRLWTKGEWLIDFIERDEQAFPSGGGRKLGDDDVRRIRRLLAKGRLTRGEIATRFGVSTATIAAIARGRAHQGVR